MRRNFSYHERLKAVAEQVAARDAIIVSLGGEVPEAVAPQPSIGGKSRFSVYSGADAGDIGSEQSRPALLKRRKTDLSALPVRERTKIRKASMTAGDSWADLHGTKDRPDKQFVRNWAKKLKKKKTEDASAGAGPSSVSEGAGAGQTRRGSAVRRLSERLRRGSDTARV